MEIKENNWYSLRFTNRKDIYCDYFVYVKTIDEAKVITDAYNIDRKCMQYNAVFYTVPCYQYDVINKSELRKELDSICKCYDFLTQFGR